MNDRSSVLSITSLMVSKLTRAIRRTAGTTIAPPLIITLGPPAPVRTKASFIEALTYMLVMIIIIAPIISTIRPTAEIAILLPVGMWGMKNGPTMKSNPIRIIIAAIPAPPLLPPSSLRDAGLEFWLYSSLERELGM